MLPREQRKCPICGDPRVYALWVMEPAPAGCAADKSWHNGGPITVTNVAECSYQRRKAEQAALFRRVAPECFDANGNMLPGKLYDVLMKLPEGTELIS